MAPTIVTRFQKVPVTLYRLQGAVKPLLREHGKQMALNRSSYDYTIGADGFMHPAVGDKFIGPNGMSLRPVGPTLLEFLSSFRGKHVYEIAEGAVVPDGLVLLHEHSDHYSLQTTVKCTPKEYHQLAGEFLLSQKYIPIEEFREFIMSTHPWYSGGKKK
jgi:hypothetical protein